MQPRIVATREIVQQIERSRQHASHMGDLHLFKKSTAIHEIINQSPYDEIADLLSISVDTIRIWINRFLAEGVGFLKRAKGKKGRPAKLTKNQKRELYQIIEAGPEASGYLGGCWRSPMIQHLINKVFGVFYSVKYICELLKGMGLTFQKASFESAFLDEEKRREWIEKKWPEILRKSRELNSWIMFGDEASFPMWGSLTYTWAPKGKQPKVRTAGQRKGYKVFGAIEYWSGKFYYQAIEEKFSSETYIEFLQMILSNTKKKIILVQDGAPYHKSAAVSDFIENCKRLTVYQLPSYSPDYNPIEKLWKKVKQHGVHLKYFASFEALKTAVDAMLEVMENAQNEILVLFGFYQRRST